MGKRRLDVAPRETTPPKVSRAPTDGRPIDRVAVTLYPPTHGIGKHGMLTTSLFVGLIDHPVDHCPRQTLSLQVTL